MDRKEDDLARFVEDGDDRSDPRPGAPQQQADADGDHDRQVEGRPGDGHGGRPAGPGEKGQGEEAGEEEEGADGAEDEELSGHGANISARIVKTPACV